MVQGMSELDAEQFALRLPPTAIPDLKRAKCWMQVSPSGGWAFAKAGMPVIYAGGVALVGFDSDDRDDIAAQIDAVMSQTFSGSTG